MRRSACAQRFLPQVLCSSCHLRSPCQAIYLSGPRITFFSIGLSRETYSKQWKTSRQLSHQRPAFVCKYASTSSCEALCLLKDVADISEDLKKDSKGAVKAVVEALGVAATVTQSVPYLSAISGVLAELLKIQGVRR